MYVFCNLDTALITMARELLENGTWRNVRGHHCLELSHPVILAFSNPTDRYVTIPQRKWNKYLPWVESLWLALGMNDLDKLPGRYVKNLYNYSDDGRTWRGGYGPRLRAYNGIATDYNISDAKHRHITAGYINTVDQLRYVVETLKQDLYTRQAVIQIGDPVKDDFELDGSLKKTKDYPCSRTLQFMVSSDGLLDCTLYIRSNDIMYGLSAVNVFNWTLMQEYVANIVGVPVGRYYHIVNNLHVYERHTEKLRQLAELNLKEYQRQVRFTYTDPIDSLQEFDRLTESLYNYEHALSRGETEDILPFHNDLFDDWARVLLHYWQPHKEISFKNPFLNYIFKYQKSKS